MTNRRLVPVALSAGFGLSRMGGVRMTRLLNRSPLAMMFPPKVYFPLEIFVNVAIWFIAASFGAWWAFLVPALLSGILVLQVVQYRRYGHRRL
jgi:hypothetical protein